MNKFDSAGMDETRIDVNRNERARIDSAGLDSAGLDSVRRRHMLGAVSVSALALGFASLREALAQGKKPPGMYHLQGAVQVNGKPVRRGQVVNPGDSVQTGANSFAIFVVGSDAFMMRSATKVETSGKGDFADVLRLVTGKLLSVYSPGARRIQTTTATIGIRGTAMYLEVQAKRTYVCTCYGTIDVAPVGMPKMSEVISTNHHEEPRYIYADSSMPVDKMMPKAPVINHTDSELILLESLVNRKPPFVGKGYAGY
ncbi:MAG: hypothetical protein ACKVQK_00360 [Burkholderiales bacterium]